MKPANEFVRVKLMFMVNGKREPRIVVRSVADILRMEPRPETFCLDEACNQHVRLHKEGKGVPAHYEHMEHNPKCPHSYSFGEE